MVSDYTHSYNILYMLTTMAHLFVVYLPSKKHLLQWASELYVNTWCVYVNTCTYARVMYYMYSVISV